MTVIWDSNELFSMSEAVAAIEEYGGEAWQIEDVFSAALMGRVSLLCRADRVGVVKFIPDRPIDDSETTHDSETLFLDKQPSEGEYSGYFDPIADESGKNYLKALIRGEQPTQGIRRFIAHGDDDNDCLTAWRGEGVRPSIEDFYIQGLHLSLLIANLIQRNQYHYVSIFVAAELMAIAEGEKWLKPRSRFGSIHSQYHTSRIVQAAQQCAFPIWKKKLNGYWYCQWGKDVYSTSQVLVTDIERHFGLILPLENRSLTLETLNAFLNDKDALAGLFAPSKQPPTPTYVIGVRKIYKFIINNVAPDFDFSTFDMDTVEKIAGYDTQGMLEAINPINGKNRSLASFQRDCLQKASFIFKKLAKKPS